MKSKGLSLTTRFNQNRPVTLAGLTFFSKRLSGEEEMTLQELQLEAAVIKPGQVVENEVDFVADLLRFRAVTDTERAKITRDFVLDNVGKHTAVNLMNYLRNGGALKPGETFDLPVFSDPEADPETWGRLILEDRVFETRAFSYREALVFAHRMAEHDPRELAAEAQGMVAQAHLIDTAELDAAAEAGHAVDFQAQLEATVAEGRRILAKSKETSRLTAQVTAELLNARLLEGEPIDGKWLLDQITDGAVGQIVSYLTDGEVEIEEPAEEGETPAPNVGGPANA